MSNPLIVILIMAGVVKFSNPRYNPQVASDVLCQIASLAYQGSIFVERPGGKVSNVPYSCSNKADVIRIANMVFRDALDVVRVSIPALNIVLYR